MSTPSKSARAMGLRGAGRALACGLLAACAACGPTAENSGEGAGDSGPRYVVLSPALGVMLRDLGHEDRIVARHAYDLVLDESLPVAGELGRLDYEVLLGVEPTHVLIEWGGESQPLPDRLRELSRDRGFEILRFSMLTLDDIRDAVDRLESELPAADRGPEEGYWQERMQARWAGPEPGEGDRFVPAGRILLLAGADSTIGVLGPGSWHHQILVALGGTPAITEGAPWMELSAEDVLRLAPDAILLIQPRGRDDGPTAASTEDLLARLGVVARLDIPAVETGRIALIDDPLAHTPSTAMVGLTDQMAGILNRWAVAAESRSVIPTLP